MKQLITCLLSALFLAIPVYSSSCAEARGADTSPSTSSASELGSRQFSEILAYDFNDSLNACDFITFENCDDSNSVSASMVSGLQRNIGKYVPDRQFSARELRALGVANMGDENSASIFMTMFKVYFYYREHQCLPVSGMDLFPELSTQTGYDGLLNAKADDDVFGKYHDGISPITGSFVPSFTASEWIPGAWNIEIVDDPEEAVRLSGMTSLTHPVLPDKDGSMPEDKEPVTLPVIKVWKVTIYGERPGDVIFDNYIWPMTE